MTRRLDIALTLMRMALALLDEEEDETLAGCRLQHAIDSVGTERNRKASDPESGDRSNQ